MFCLNENNIYHLYTQGIDIRPARDAYFAHGYIFFRKIKITKRADTS